MNKMGSTIGHKIDCESERPAAHTQQKLTQVTPPPGLEDVIDLYSGDLVARFT